MLELVKIVGGITWIVGLVLLFTVPSAGLLVLAIAIALSIVSINRTRAQRHNELVDAARKPQATPSEAATPSAPPIISASDRLVDLDKLRDSGAITDKEYEAKRQQIIDSL